MRVCLAAMQVYSDLFEIWGRDSHPTNITPYNPMHIGCKTYVPTFWASKPVKNGDTTPPLLPIALIMLILDVCIGRGSSLLNTAMAQGYTGPNSRPTMATATVSPIMFGMSQIMS